MVARKMKFVDFAVIVGALTALSEGKSRIDFMRFMLTSKAPLYLQKRTTLL